MSYGFLGSLLACALKETAEFSGKGSVTELISD